MVDLGRRPPVVLHLGSAAEVTGVNPQMLRVYEQKGLLEPHRTEGGTRRYSGHESGSDRRDHDTCSRPDSTWQESSPYSACRRKPGDSRPRSTDYDSVRPAPATAAPGARGGSGERTRHHYPTRQPRRRQ